MGEIERSKDAPKKVDPVAAIFGKPVVAISIFAACIGVYAIANASSCSEDETSAASTYTPAEPTYTAPAPSPVHEPAERADKPACKKGCRCGNSCIDCSKTCRH